MQLILGLGNPGEMYKKARHNVGFMAVDLLAKKLGIEGFKQNNKLNSLVAVCKNRKLGLSDLILAKPATFMNLSGEAMQKLVTFYKINISKLWIIHDDLDIKLGQYKIQFGVGPKEHNGLLSVYEKLGTKDFWHVRIGVENDQTRISEKGEKIRGETYVLQNFTDSEFEVLTKTLDNVTDDLLGKIKNG